MFLFNMFTSQIYNEKIGDLIDPTQRNLEVKIYFLIVITLIHSCLNFALNFLSFFLGVYEHYAKCCNELCLNSYRLRMMKKMDCMLRI